MRALVDLIENAAAKSERVEKKDNIPAKKVLRKRCLEALIKCWESDPPMGSAVHFAKNLADCPDADDREFLLAFNDALRCRAHIRTRVRVFVAQNMPSLSEALWQKRPFETLMDVALRQYNAARNIARQKIYIRGQDKRHDWGTVK